MAELALSKMASLLNHLDHDYLEYTFLPRGEKPEQK